MTVLKNLIENKNEPTYLSGIAKETGLSNSIVAKVITHWLCQESLWKNPSASMSELSV
jgi:hypothetical protein